MDDTKTVFISYSWDSEDHKNWVLNLATKLTDNGVYVIFDRFDLKAGKAMTQFMEKSVNNADKILLIMTPNYKDKADNRTGGVGYEYSMVTQELYVKQDNDKFIPIRRVGSYDESAPKFLSTLISHDMSNDTAFENSFIELLRIIYDEPEIKRPPLGKKPIFITTPQTTINTSLIDEKVDLAISAMTIFAKWTIDIELKSLKDLSKANLFKQITTNALVDKELKHLLPFILIATNKVSHHPDIIYEMPLQRYIAYNHLIHEVMKIEDGLIHYEFAEYSNHDFWLLLLSQPFSSLFYFVVITKAIHTQLSKPIDIKIHVNFLSDKKSILYGKHSPFEVGFLFENYEIPGNKASETITLTEISKDSIFNLFEKLYSLFVSENPKSQRPYVTINRQHFDMITDEFLKS